MSYYCNYNKYVTSYGVILFNINPVDKKTRYCVVKRRDTIEYISIVRGFCSVDNLQCYIQYLTFDEKQRLLNLTFDELWDELWVNKICWSYINTKENSERWFNSIRNYLIELIKKLPVDHIENQSRLWGFPKGRKNKKEMIWDKSDIPCAIREFIEETKINININNILCENPLYEIVQGTDCVEYRNIYYIGFINGITEDIVINRSDTSEITEIRWKTYQELKSIFDIHKQQVLKNVINRISKFIQVQ